MISYGGGAKKGRVGEPYGIIRSGESGGKVEQPYGIIRSRRKKGSKVEQPYGIKSYGRCAKKGLSWGTAWHHAVGKVRGQSGATVTLLRCLYNFVVIFAEVCGSPNIGVAHPNIGVTHPNIVVTLPNIGVTFPNLGVTFPNIDVMLLQIL